MADYPTINQGFSGKYVVLLQRALAVYGTHTAAIDGGFGTATTAALKTFQKLEGLTVDGRAGKETWARLIALALIPPPQPYEPGTVVVQFDREAAVQADGPALASGAGADLSAVSALLSAKGIGDAWHVFDVAPEAQAEYDERLAAAGRTGPSMSDFVVLQFGATANVEAIAGQLKQLPGVVDAAPDERLTLAQTDPLLGNSDMPVGDPPTQWYIHRCRADEAWAMSTGEGVTIGIVDNSFHVAHEDLAANVDLERAWAVGSESAGSVPAPTGAADHGTGAAGFAAAVGDNGVGIKGFAPKARIIPVHADPPTTVKVALGVFYLWWVRGPDEPMVISMSLERTALTIVEGDGGVAAAIQWVTTFGIPVCIAAGNTNGDTGRDLNGDPILDRGSIVVGASRWPDDERLDVTAWGWRMNVRAPGDGDHDTTCGSPARGTLYRRYGGTSGATPKVAGTAALMLSANPGLDPAEVREIIGATAVGSTTDAQGHQIGRRLDSWAAVHEALNRWLVEKRGQSGWRYCRKCAALHFSPAQAAAGVCPADGEKHDPSASGNYRLVRNPGRAFGDPAWRRCGDCQCLYRAGAAANVCPVHGTSHVAVAGSKYSLAVDVPAVYDQAGWRRCKNCQVLFFAGPGGKIAGRCPSAPGNSHSWPGADDYVLKQV
ncbi:MAG: S8 family serine peptidase [Actinomycetota bacterium]|nr:S8 family serine peptidase [Actinomycetota bacterium]